MVGPNDESYHVPAEQDAPEFPTEPDLNPFAGRHSVRSPHTELDLDGLLDRPNAFVPPAEEAARPSAEAISDAVQAVEKSVDLIAEVLVMQSNPENIAFPICPDITIINTALNQLAETPLGLGHGPFPAEVMLAWSRFVQQTVEQYRTYNRLGSTTLAPLKIEVPSWLQNHTNFDILPACTLMDIEIKGTVNSHITSKARHCRVTFQDTVQKDAVVGNDAQRCSYVFKSDLHAVTSFQKASYTSIHVAGNQSGKIGTMITSRATCEGRWDGIFYHKGQGCSYGSNVNASAQS